jgi:uncharacterized cupredoxin-like copper-binding protein
MALKRSVVYLTVLGALLGAALLSSACTSAGASGGMAGMDMGGGSTTGTINVSLDNWTVKASKTSAKAGLVTFHVMYDMANMGSMADGGNVHDMQVARKNADGTFEVIGEVKGLGMGASKNLTLNLAAGDYELQCNHTEQVRGQLVSHYQKGMHTPFTVS